MACAETRARVVTEYLLRALGHEIRTPLSIIAQESYVLSKSSEQKERGTITEKVQEVSKIVSALEAVFQRRSVARTICPSGLMSGFFGTSMAQPGDADLLMVNDDGSWSQIFKGLKSLADASGAKVEVVVNSKTELVIHLRAMRAQVPLRNSPLLSELFAEFLLPILPCVDVLLLSVAESVTGTRVGDSTQLTIGLAVNGKS